MKRVLLLVCVAAGVARAGALKPPAGWTADPALAASVANQASRAPHFGGLKAVATAEAFRAPDKSGALYVTRIAATVTEAAQRDAAASTELDELTAVLARQHTTPETYREEPSDTALKAFVVYGSAGVTTWSQMIVAGDAQQLVAVIGECVFNAEAPKPAIEACTKSLAELEAGIDLGARVPLKRLVNQPPAPVAPPPGAGSQSTSLVEGGVPMLPPRQIPADRQRTEPDRRPIYVGAGLVAFAALFWWNRKRRDKFEREDRGEPVAKRPKRSRDADADDLHAAAEARDTEETDTRSTAAAGDAKDKSQS
jgi:hypothetical protein